MKKGALLVILLILISSISIAQSSYEETVNLPSYDASNSEMFLIKSNKDWSHINDSDKKYFFVTPGDYSNDGKKIKLTTKGTSDSKRYILLYNGNNTHPGKLNWSKLARVSFILQNTNYWVIDRMAYWNEPLAINPIAIKNSDNNIINRYYMHNVGNGIYLFDGSDNNTIQNCRIERDDITIFHDRAAIGLINSGTKSIVTIKNTKILNNEVRNFVDGFQAIRMGAYKPDSYEGTIVDYNHFYIDNTIYTDGKGNHDPNGNFAYAENPMDLKVGSENPNNPLIISNNIMWGFRQADRTNSNLADAGAIMPIHYNVNNTIIKNNIFYDSAYGFSIGAPRAGFAFRNSSIVNNIFYDIKKYTCHIAYTDNITFQNNLYKNIAKNYEYWFSVGKNNTNIMFSENMSVNTYDKPVYPYGQLSSISKDNVYYKSLPSQISDVSDIILTTDPTADYTDFVFTTDRYTNSPRKITIPKIIKNTNTRNHSPTATNVIITGTPEDGQTLTLNYKYSDPDGDTEGESIIIWSTPTKELQKGTKKTFTIPKEYCGETIGAWVRPKDSKGKMPELAIAASNNMLKITCKTNENHSPTATNVIIKGTPEDGQTLTLNYKYSDPDGDTEGESIITWSTPTKELQRGTSKTFVIPEGYCEGTIGAWVYPKDYKEKMPKLAIAASNNMLKLTCKTNEKDDATFNIYPNPVDNIITITDNTDELKNYTISSLLGQKIITGVLKNNATINIQNISAGTYFIELFNDNKSITKKFIKL